MNDFVLRGFCKKCEWPVQLEDKYWVHFDPARGRITTRVGCDSVEGIGFLSPAQMKIVEDAKEYVKWNPKDMSLYPSKLGEFLRDDPFLVSKILKDAGEKNKGGKQMNRKSTAFTYFYTELRIMHACMVIHDERFPPETIKHIHKAWKTLLDSGKVETRDNATYPESRPKENE